MNLSSERNRRDPPWPWSRPTLGTEGGWERFPNIVLLFPNSNRMTDRIPAPSDAAPPAERLVTTEGGTIAYAVTEGPGPLVVCAPGMGDLRSVYRFVGPAFAEDGHRVALTELRGMGHGTATWADYSEVAIARDLLALVRELGRGPAILVANSISAGAAVCAAADAPAQVAGLVLVAPFVRDATVSAGMKLVFRLALMGPWGAGTWVRYQKSKLYPSTRPVDMVDQSARLLANLREPGRMASFRRMARTDHGASSACLDRVHVPVLVVMGTADPDLPDPRAEAAWVAGRLRAEVALIDGVGHYPQAEAPERFLPPVLNFLGRVGHGA